MIQIERYFENIFNNKNIIPVRLEKFAVDHLARLKKTNPGGIYDTIIADTEALTGGFRNKMNESFMGRTDRQVAVLGKKQTRKAFIDYLQRKEGLIKSTYGKSSVEYKVFFPRGINAYRHSTDVMFQALTEAAVKEAIKYEADLGSAFRIKLSELRDAFASAFGELVSDKGKDSGARSRQRATKTALQLQLCVNICTIAARNPGNIPAAKLYFDQSLLFPAKRHHLFKAKVNPSSTKEVCTFKFSEGKRFHIMNTGAAPLSFQMRLAEVMVGRIITVQPGEKVNEPFSFFSSNGDALIAINESETVGRYMIWEIT